MCNKELQTRLVAWEMVTAQQLRHAVTTTVGTTTTWLEYLVQSHQLDDDALARRAGFVLGVPPCDLRQLARVPPGVVEQLPRDLALEHRVVPLSLDDDGDLSLGMIDPFDRAAVHEIEFFVGRRVLRQVVPATALAWAHTMYYGAHSALWPERSRRVRA